MLTRRNFIRQLALKVKAAPWLAVSAANDLCKPACLCRRWRLLYGLWLASGTTAGSGQIMYMPGSPFVPGLLTGSEAQVCLTPLCNLVFLSGLACMCILPRYRFAHLLLSLCAITQHGQEAHPRFILLLSKEAPHGQCSLACMQLALQAVKPAGGHVAFPTPSCECTHMSSVQGYRCLCGLQRISQLAAQLLHCVLC